jgi:hypothetical protein
VWVSPNVDYLKVPISSNPGGGVAELLGLEVVQLMGVGFSKSVLFKSAKLF